jgi:hypothetical protein
VPGLGALGLSVLAQVLEAGVLLCARGALNVLNCAFRCSVLSPLLQVRSPNRTGCLLMSLVPLVRVTGWEISFKKDKNIDYTSHGARSSKYFRNPTFFRLLID